MILSHILLLFPFLSFFNISSAAPNKETLRETFISQNPDAEKVRKILENAYARRKKLTKTTEAPFKLEDQVFRSIPINAEPNNEPTNPKSVEELNKNILDYTYGGDMVLNVGQATAIAKEVEQNGTRVKRQLVTDRNGLWYKNQSIPYVYHYAVPKSMIEHVESALEYWSNNTCLSFMTPRGRQDSYIRFISDDGCYSHVGRQTQAQIVSLAPGCETAAGHEIGHALGFYHEQSRYDRDEYVNIDSSNIQSGQEPQFRKEPKNVAQTFGYPYNYGSVMQYGFNAFSLHPEASTMNAKDLRYQHTMGKRNNPAFLDVKKINKLYRCQEDCKKKLDKPCHHCGFQNSRHCHKCICPPYFGGLHCESLRKGSAPICNGHEIDAQESWLSFRGEVAIKKDTKVLNELDCHWTITAPKGMQIEIEILELAYEPDYWCALRAIEINLGRFYLSGIKVCSMNQQKKYTSEGNMIAISGFVHNKDPLRFKIGYRAIPSKKHFDYKCPM